MSKNKQNDLAAGEERWKERHRRAPERDELFTTISGVPVELVATPNSVEKNDYVRDLGFPGEYPFTRGLHPTGYRGKLWTMRMFAGFGGAEETNERLRYLLKEGQTGLSIAFDMPTLMGYDTDHPLSAGEFGRCGVGVSSLADMEIVLDRIPLGEVSTSMTINGPAAILWAMYLAVAEKQGVPFSKLRGTLQNDILKEFTAQNEFIFPPGQSMRLVVDTVEYATNECPDWNPISISGYHIREAGSTAAQELAFTLADGFAYVEACLDRGLNIDDFASRLSFFFNVHNDFLEEIAKFRAARRIWAREMKEHFGAKDERSWWMRTHAQTAGAALTVQQPENNVVRVAIQALAAVLGGAQSLHTNSMDEAYALPSQDAATLALRTQQIIAHETGVTNTADPLGGSYHLEWLTNELEKQAYAYFDQIRDQGGLLRSIENGFIDREIGDAAYRYQRECDRGERITVGVNRYGNDAPEKIQLLEMDSEGEKRHLARLAEVKRSRDGAAVELALRDLRSVALSDANLMLPIIRAVKSYATLGEVTDVLRDVWGEHLPFGAGRRKGHSATVGHGGER